MANPTALLLSSAMMLDHMNMIEYGDKIRNSVNTVIGEGQFVTKDLGGNSTTQDYVKALIDNLKWLIKWWKFLNL